MYALDFLGTDGLDFLGSEGAAPVHVPPFEIRLGDCLDVLRGMADSSVDAVVTDPPYGLSQEPDIAEVLTHWLAGDDYTHSSAGFMGKTWDSFVPGPAVWREVFRVLKPGGHLLAFFGTRTYDLGVIAIRMARFEIRDQVQWIYGSGFPKSHDVSKGLDKSAGAEREVLAEGKALKRMIPGADQKRSGSWIKDNGREYVPQTTAPATPEAVQWAGWGTALKPANEPIVMARKPLIGTVAQNVLEHGTGALNIEACRVGNGADKGIWPVTARNGRNSFNSAADGSLNSPVETDTSTGRWPANVIHDGAPEVVGLFPQAKGAVSNSRSKGRNSVYGEQNAANKTKGRGDSGSAARFFYCAKASKADRDAGMVGPEKPVTSFQTANGTSGKPSSISEGRETAYKNNHPTVKPTALMRYLCRLVTPPGGLVLDPFMGSGSTGRGAILEGLRFLGIEQDETYCGIAHERIRNAVAEKWAADHE